MMDIHRDFEIGVELNRMRHAALIAQAEQDRVIRQARGIQARNWKQRLEAGFANLTQLIRARKARLPTDRVGVGDEATSSVGPA